MDSKKIHAHSTSGGYTEFMIMLKHNDLHLISTREHTHTNRSQCSGHKLRMNEGRKMPHDVRHKRRDGDAVGAVNVCVAVFLCLCVPMIHYLFTAYTNLHPNTCSITVYTRYIIWYISSRARLRIAHQHPCSTSHYPPNIIGPICVYYLLCGAPEKRCMHLFCRHTRLTRHMANGNACMLHDDEEDIKSKQLHARTQKHKFASRCECAPSICCVCKRTRILYIYCD